jgi:16S rRNA (adenine1518-N6/adenine1519-N6)-dimethyltransferase
MHTSDPLTPPDLHAKKSLGQNFLKSERVADLIVESGEITSRDTVVEIGPGKGVLTTPLVAVAREVIAIEKDDRLALHLALKYKEAIETEKLRLIHGDALLWKPEELLLQAGGYKLIANIPYYITGAIIRKFLSETAHPSTMVLMLQKEVARRIVARDGKESILSIAVKAYGTPIYVETVKASMFSPAPKVDSAILKIATITKERFSEIPEDRFFAFLRAGFGRKRKKLSSNLSELLPASAVDEAFTAVGLSDNARAEELSLDEWFMLTKTLVTLPASRS